MPECEYEELCNMVYGGLETYVDCPLSDDPGDCDWLRRIVAIEKSVTDDPQFKKQSEEKIRKAIDDFREDLVEAVKDGYIPLTHVSIVENAKDAVCEIIRTHEKETE